MRLLTPRAAIMFLVCISLVAFPARQGVAHSGWSPIAARTASTEPQKQHRLSSLHFRVSLISTSWDSRDDYCEESHPAIRGRSRSSHPGRRIVPVFLPCDPGFAHPLRC